MNLIVGDRVGKCSRCHRLVVKGKFRHGGKLVLMFSHETETGTGRRNPNPGEFGNVGRV